MRADLGGQLVQVGPIGLQVFRLGLGRWGGQNQGNDLSTVGHLQRLALFPYPSENLAGMFFELSNADGLHRTSPCAHKCVHNIIPPNIEPGDRVFRYSPYPWWIVLPHRNETHVLGTGIIGNWRYPDDIFASPFEEMS